jgi:hypothetical protein
MDDHPDPFSTPVADPATPGTERIALRTALLGATARVQWLSVACSVAGMAALFSLGPFLRPHQAPDWRLLACVVLVIAIYGVSLGLILLLPLARAWAWTVPLMLALAMAFESQAVPVYPPVPWVFAGVQLAIIGPIWRHCRSDAARAVTSREHRAAKSATRFLDRKQPIGMDGATVAWVLATIVGFALIGCGWRG